MVKKEIRMDFEEYQEMLKLIELQQRQLDEFFKDDRAVLVDYRVDHKDNFSYLRRIGFFNSSAVRIPKVTGDIRKAKEMMKLEFDQLNKIVSTIQDDLVRSYKMETKLENKKRKWWEF